MHSFTAISIQTIVRPQSGTKPLSHSHLDTCHKQNHGYTVVPALSVRGFILRASPLKCHSEKEKERERDGGEGGDRA